MGAQVDVTGRLRLLLPFEFGRKGRAADSPAPKFAAILSDGANVGTIGTRFLHVNVGPPCTWHRWRDLRTLAAGQFGDRPLCRPDGQRSARTNFDGGFSGIAFGISGQNQRRIRFVRLYDSLVAVRRERGGMPGRDTPANIVPNVTVSAYG